MVQYKNGGHFRSCEKHMRSRVAQTIRWLFWCSLILAGLMLSSCGVYEFQGTVVDRPAPPFTLTAHTGEPFNLHEQRGKVVLLYFGFTSCPDVCPTDLADLAAVRRELGSDADDVQVVLVTVDPERDTAERLQGYVTSFDPSFLGLRGTPAELEEVYKQYGVSAAKRELPESALQYTIDHSAYTYVIDKAGQWRILFQHDAPVETQVEDIRRLAREQV